VADAPAAAAAAALVERLFAVMGVNEPGGRSRLVVEVLHDFRVAVRRARTIVRAAKGVLPDETRDELGTELKWLGDMTTPVRDLDVYLAHGAPEASLEPVWAVLEARHRAAQRALIDALDGPRYARFRATAAAATRPRSVPAKSRTTGQWAAKAVGKAHRRLLERGRRATTPAELHEVRKAGKRLRYLLDAFSPVLGAEATDGVIADLKALQNVLGDLQDSTVHGEMLTEVGNQLPTAGPATLMALGGLVEAERRRQRKAAAAFADRFARFAGAHGDVEDLLAGLGSR
jgi:CHAD domain-containing protein